MSAIDVKKSSKSDFTKTFVLNSLIKNVIRMSIVNIKKRSNKRLCKNFHSGSSVDVFFSTSLVGVIKIITMIINSEDESSETHP